MNGDQYSSMAPWVGTAADRLRTRARRFVLVAVPGTFVVMAIANLVAMGVRAPKDVFMWIFVLSLTVVLPAMLTCVLIHLVLMRRAAQAAGQYLELGRYLTRTSLPQAILRAGPKAVELFLTTNSIPRPGEVRTSRAAESPEGPDDTQQVIKRPASSGWQQVSSAVSPKVWRISLVGFWLVLGGVACALLAAGVALVAVVEGTSPGPLFPVLEAGAVILFVIGTPLMYTYVRHIGKTKD
ncbi:hypothetical protein E3O44_17270 [Cryobacterium algoricola]|uniref:Uncharacterized protein n=1 Tax=Cryobacterium algoricola TaxID=1259183 RepID=A0ABY2I7E4_9MICO|nr:hypothetical protein [Cryobacterium algoricola]TFB83621.1 hypothetical protein E3O44_17270 [Cryobacterium algoricola]